MPTRQAVTLSVAILLVGCGGPPASTALRIETAGFRWEVVWSCAGVGLPPVRMQSQGNELRFVAVATGDDVPLIWPNGFAARVVDGQATLFASDGSVVGHEGDQLPDLGTCDSRGGVPVVGSVGPKVYRLGGGVGSADGVLSRTASQPGRREAPRWR